MVLNPKHLLAASLLTAFSLLFASPQLYAAQDDAVNLCLQEQVLIPENDTQTVGQLRAHCVAILSPSEPGDERIAESVAQTNIMRPYSFADDMRSGFVQAYKNNYISVGKMRNQNGQAPFSGKTLDIKFELGMKFGIFPDVDGLEPLSPLKFGYSQRSWWDISEDSAPFKEHNYNPEIFWDFTEALARPSSKPRLHIFDLVGIEHQSNGLDGVNSRSWDRVYASRNLRISEAWSWTFKYWQAMNLGGFNEDIEDYLGSAEVTTHFDINNWARLNLKTLLGRKSDKLSYQLDLIVPMSRWINSRFFLSYYNGYGEALITYNKKTSSIRAGFYFPLGF